ncbi:MAG TPA: phosphoribosylformylglycinamidine synthase subunit PurQ [Candidatus Poseidoniales archaeon]|nr:phosphoribosylformylglycinamidine synthase subunit PurQ [Candidatus Poseidoniales archaeon]
MIDQPRVAVLSGFGINCETETIAVFEMAGAIAERVHVNRLVNGELSLEDYHIMAVPGGFSFGDHLGSGRLMGNRLRFGLREQVREFVKAGKPVIGICNGFQVLVKMGLLPGDEEVSLTQTASLALNDSGHYENRWATLEFDPNSPCIWTKGLIRIRVPVRHGEGKFVTDNRALLDEWAESGQLAVRYVDPKSTYPASSDEVLPYPISPNQSWRNIAGVCDPSGLVFGLMPHPEANHSTWLGATWTRELSSPEEHGEGEGMAIFHNAVEYVRKSC